MEQQEIIEIIKSKEKWNSKELIKLIKSESKKQVKITFCHIGGYECLKDGTKTEVCRTLDDIQEYTAYPFRSSKKRIFVTWQ